MQRIELIRIKGFRSLADVELVDLPPLVVLIGANGSGKSNFIRFFEMLRWMLRSRQLAAFVGKHGGADDQLFQGSKTTTRIDSEIHIRTEKGRNDYRFQLGHASPDRLIFMDERFRCSRNDLPTQTPWETLGSGHAESAIVEVAQSDRYAHLSRATARVLVNLLRGAAVFQFHDTSMTANIKKRWDTADSARLRSDGGNLAAVLYRLRQEDVRRHEFICRQVSRVLPNFQDFAIEESYGKVELQWTTTYHQKPIGAHLTSDGSLRAFALITLFNLPPSMRPDILFLDGPELGLHPAALDLIGAMIQSYSVDRQVVIATQSPLLVDCLEPEVVHALDLHENRTTFARHNRESYAEWLEDYTMGELWEKNVFGGYP